MLPFDPADPSTREAPYPVYAHLRAAPGQAYGPRPFPVLRLGAAPPVRRATFILRGLERLPVATR